MGDAKKMGGPDLANVGPDHRHSTDDCSGEFTIFRTRYSPHKIAMVPLRGVFHDYFPPAFTAAFPKKSAPGNDLPGKTARIRGSFNKLPFLSTFLY
jgi:hypothetical protein